MSERILVIKLGALGDLVLCMGAFAALRAHHPDAEIALLTMSAFADFARQMPWFDKVLIDTRPKMTQPLGWGKLISTVRSFAPSRVYDFQGKFRQELLFWVLGGPRNKNLMWSGAARGCSHPRLWPPQKGMHYTDFLAAQLAAAGVLGFVGDSVREAALVPPPLRDRCRRASMLGGGSVLQETTDRVCRENPSPIPSRKGRGDSFFSPDLSWLDAPLDDFALPERFALFIPGCAPSRPYKRWPPLHYAMLAKKLMAEGVTVFAVGTKADAQSIGAIRALAPAVGDLAGKTNLKQLAALARRAELVVGNDTGPTHLAAAVGARTLALMSDQVDPHWSSPRGPQTTWLQGSPLSALGVENVWETLYSAR